MFENVKCIFRQFYRRPHVQGGFGRRVEPPPRQKTLKVDFGHLFGLNLQSCYLLNYGPNVTIYSFSGKNS